MRKFIAALTVVACWIPGLASAEEVTDRPRVSYDLPELEAGPCYCTHVIYFVPLGATDLQLDTNGALQNSGRSLAAWFAREMKMAPRMDLVGTGPDLDITFVRGQQQAAWYTSLSRLTEELYDRGFSDPRKRYLVYAAINRGSLCGESMYGGYPGWESTLFAAVYLNSAGCGGSEFGDGSVAKSGRSETIAAHEWLHAEGLVSLASPHHCPVSAHHVCTAGLYWLSSQSGIPDPEQSDIMFPVTNAKLSIKVLDRGRDDYLDHGLPGLTDLRRSIWLEAAG